jgi:UDP-N-acetylmuramyl pentapeptide phosphotransferase/UDP-N-acetylglucosamine-1-phosphate transferase
MINLYNFMDGMDGFAGGMTVIGFAALSILGYMAGHAIFTIASLVVVFSAFGFLVFNYPPARIFMGDTGSASLGLLAGAFSLWGSKEYIYPFWVSLIIFSPFILDATVTLLKRLIRGDVIWQAHKSHYYQRLVEKGWGHKRTVLFEYGIMLICALAAITATIMPLNIQWIVIAVIVLMYTLSAYYIDKWLSCN